MPLRVAHVSVIHRARDVRIFEKQCRTLARAGYEVHVVAGDRDGRERDGVRFHPVTRKFVRPRLREQWRPQLAAWRHSLRLRADVYHLHDPHLIPLGLALKLRGAQVLYDAHENYPDHAHAKLAGRPLRATVKAGVWRGLEAAARQRFDGFVCACEGIAGRFPPERTTVLHNFPLQSDYLPADAAPYPRRLPTVVFVGVMRPIRGVPDAIRAMGLLPDRIDCRLRLIGRMDFPPPESDPGWGRVDYVPWCDREAVIHELSRARVGLAAMHPHANESAGIRSNKLFEYMAAGLPVVVGDMPGWRRLVEEAGCGLAVDPRDPAALAEAIAHLIANPGEAEEMGRRGRAAVEQRFNWDREAGRLLDLYGSLA